jgi:hypothetical protein
MITLIYQQTLAQIRNPALSSTIQTWTGEQFFQSLLPRLVLMGLIIGATIFFFILIVGAIQWIGAGGDKVSIESARKKVMNAIIGLVILFLIFAIAVLVENFFGVNILNINLGSLYISSSNPVNPPPTPTSPGPTFPSVGNPNCPCIDGDCAITGTIAIGPGNQCYQCMDDGWVALGSGATCRLINCPPCP